MNKFMGVMILLLVSSCITPSYKVKEGMLPNGHWVFGVYTSDTCAQLISASKSKTEDSVEENFSIPILNKKSLNEVIYPNVGEESNAQQCIDLFKKSLTNRSKELCGSDNFTLYGCLNTENESEIGGFKLITADTMNEYKLKCYLNCNVK